MWDRSDYLAAAVPAIGAESSVNLAKLAKVHVLPEMLTHCANVGVVLVGGDLIAAIGTDTKIGNKGVSINAVSITNTMADNQFGLAVECNPQHRAAPQRSLDRRNCTDA